MPKLPVIIEQSTKRLEGFIKHNGELIGEVTMNMNKKTRTAQVDHMYVHPDRRQEGHASNILEELTAVAQSQHGIKRITRDGNPVSEKAEFVFNKYNITK